MGISKSIKSIIYDVLICGAGPVGLSLAILLHKYSETTLRIALIDENLEDFSACDIRSIAVAYGSQQLLRTIGIWNNIIQSVTEIHEVDVSYCKFFRHVLIQREEYALPALGYVVYYSTLVKALTEAVLHNNITILRPYKVEKIEENKDYVSVTLTNGNIVFGTIVVQAEGGISSNLHQKKIVHKDSPVAIVTTIKTHSGVLHRAFECFTINGPLALLPHNKGYALIWCVHRTIATQLLLLNNEQFLQHLYGAIGTFAGYFKDLGHRYSHPFCVNMQPILSTRIIAIGNASQTLHPVAGQGFNLGLRDAVVLSKLLTRSALDLKVLPQFFQQRYLDRNLTYQLTNLMSVVFSHSSPNLLLQILLGLSLEWIDLIRPIKNVLVKHLIFGWR